MSKQTRLANEYHGRAMALCDEAWINSLRGGDPEVRKLLYRQSHRWEMKAARIALKLHSVFDYKILRSSASAIWQNYLDCCL